MNNKPIIVIINGISLAGKDTFCMYCNQFAEAITMSTVDEVKRIAYEEFGWNGKKDEAGRRLLAALRAAWNAYNGGANEFVIDQINDLAWGNPTPQIHNPTPQIVFVMIREFPEMMYFKNHPKLRNHVVKTMWVTKLDNNPGPTEQSFIDMIPIGYKFDHYILNTSDRRELLLSALRFVMDCKLTKYKSLDMLGMDADKLAEDFDKARNYHATI